MNRAERRRLAKDQSRRGAVTPLGSPEGRSPAQDILARQSDHVDANHMLGIVAFQSNQLDEAIIRFRKALAVRPGFAEAWHHLGLALFQSGAVAEAIGALRRAVRNDSQNDGYWEIFSNVISNVSFSEIDGE